MSILKEMLAPEELNVPQAIRDLVARYNLVTITAKAPTEEDIKRWRNEPICSADIGGSRTNGQLVDALICTNLVKPEVQEDFTKNLSVWIGKHRTGSEAGKYVVVDSYASFR